MSQNADEARRDAISTVVDAEIFDFMAGTAATAQRTDDIVDLLVGAQVGLARFMWTVNLNGLPPAGLADRVRATFLNTFEQLADAGRAGHA